MRGRAKAVRVAIGMVIAGTVVLAVSSCSQPQLVTVESPVLIDTPLPEAATEPLHDAVAYALAASGASGAIAGVWVPWSGAWVAGVGNASPGGPEVTSDMRFRTTTATRMMTCDVLYQVAAEGIVALDDSVTTWVSGVADLGEVTLKQLCDSTSGTGSFQRELFTEWVENPTRQWAPKELVSYGLGNATDTPPGQAYTSSDAGYVLLGLALERATGLNADEMLKRYVFDRLGLSNMELPNPAPAPPGAPTLSGFHIENDADGAPRCTKPTDVTTLSSSVGFTDSGVVSTITDLGTYVRAVAADALVPADAGRFDKTLPPYGDAPSWYAAGGGAMHAGPLIGQYGSIPGYISAAYSDPTSGLTVAVVLNDSRAGAPVATYLAWQLAAIASKIPVTIDGRDPVAGLPWTAEQYHDSITSFAVCPLPESEPAA